MCAVVAAGEVLSQLRRALEYCVLALLAERSATGSTWSAPSGRSTGWSPVREPSTHCCPGRPVATTWRESDAGPPRKYDAITDEGRHALAEFTAEWRRFRDAVDTMLSKGA